MSPKDQRILVIDDDPDMHEALRLILEPAGFEVTCCATGSAGLAAMRRDPPDLVLLDIMLASPAEGFHLAHEVKCDAQLKAIPVIMISALGDSLEQGFAEETGDDSLAIEAFINKPFQATTILEKVSGVLEKRKSDGSS